MLEEASVPRDLIDLIFPNLKGLIDCHCSLNEEFKAIRKSENVVGDFAHVLVEKVRRILNLIPFVIAMLWWW